MDPQSSATTDERLAILSRGQRRWRLAGSAAVAVAAAAVLVSVVGRPGLLRAQTPRASESTVILKFGGYYINAQMITYIDFQTERNNNAVLVYFAGDTRNPLRLGVQYAEAMRPWLEGHSFDLGMEPEKDPTPKGVRPFKIPEK